MVDLIQIITKDPITVERIWSNPLLSTMLQVHKTSKRTGEIYKKDLKEYNDIIFKREPHFPRNDKEGKQRIRIVFKPHYFFNNNSHNANDFNVSNCINTIREFIDLFDLHDFDKYPINHLEYGVNFILDGYGKELISYDSYFQRRQFVPDESLQYSKKAKKFNPKTGELLKYLSIKFYAKGFQFPEFCNPDTLRYEAFTLSPSKCKFLGINNIGDLLKVEVYENLKEDILKHAKDTLILEPKPRLDFLNKRDKKSFINDFNSFNWYEAIQSNRNADFNDKKRRYLNLLDKTGFNINDEFYKTIDRKLNSLFPEKRNYLPQAENIENRNYLDIDKGEILTNTDRRICPITNLDISMQKRGSNLLSNTGLKYYEKKEPETFKRIATALLTGRYNEFEKSIYSKISKQIRNRYYNNLSIFFNDQLNLF